MVRASVPVEARLLRPSELGLGLLSEEVAVVRCRLQGLLIADLMVSVSAFCWACASSSSLLGLASMLTGRLHIS